MNSNSKRRNMIGILLYLVGVVLFVIANSAVVSGSPIDLEYFERIILCSIAVISIIAAPFVYRSKTIAGTIIKFVMAVVLIYGIIAFGGFEDNKMAGLISVIG